MRNVASWQVCVFSIQSVLNEFISGLPTPYTHLIELSNEYLCLETPEIDEVISLIIE